ncbi:MAG: hypothetical protein ABJA61_09580 [Caldimonas sp.]
MRSERADADPSFSSFEPRWLGLLARVVLGFVALLLVLALVACMAAPP